ncbi:MAG: ABC transporter ATP-binding protein [Bacillota bacterium]|nr:ABC transporter ATP-binding protein [Bacillota bacterium]
MTKKDGLIKQLDPLWPYVRPHVGLVWGMLFFTTLQVVANLGISRGMGLALDAGLASNLGLFKVGIVWVVICWATLDLTFFIRLLCNGALGERVSHDLRAAATNHLSVAKYAAMRTGHTAEYASRLSNDLTLIRSLLAVELQFFIRAPIQCVLTLCYMLFLSWKVTLVSLAMLPLLIYLSNLVSRPISKQSQQAQAEMASITVLAQDAANGMVVTKAFNLSGLLAQRFRDIGKRQAEAQVALATTQGKLNAVSFLFNMGPFLILFGYGGYEVIAGRLTLGGLIVLLNLLGNLAWPLQAAAQSYGRTKAAAAAAERFHSIFDLPIEKQSEGVAFVADEVCAIELRNVDFSYNPGKPVFEDLSLTVGRGETVAIVGHSGSGKSTLLTLLLGLVEPEQGIVKICGQSLTAETLPQARHLFSYVPQDSALFGKTVRDNIRLGRLDASDADIEAAAQQAFAHGFIQDLPRGYDTVLGEDGVGLSGGQKQRISIARAILRDAPILLLDEATSALDTESEARIHEAIQTLRAGRTMLIVAHRLSTIRSADRILVLDQGRVAEEGTHSSLLNQDGLYASLYRHQFSDTSVSAAAGA